MEVVLGRGLIQPILCITQIHSYPPIFFQLSYFRMTHHVYKDKIPSLLQNRKWYSQKHYLQRLHIRKVAKQAMILTATTSPPSTSNQKTMMLSQTFCVSVNSDPLLKSLGKVSFQGTVSLTKVTDLLENKTMDCIIYKPICGIVRDLESPSINEL